MDEKVLKEVKKEEYMRYIKEHIENVIASFEEMKTLFSDCSFIRENDIYNQLSQNILIHDRSKYSDEEFDAYRRHFHYINEKEKEESKADFEEAWKHHYTVNGHHWEHYYNELTGECKEIPDVYLGELIADWMAMSMKFGGTPLTYYTSKKDSIILHPATRNKLESLLSRFE